MKKSMSAPSLLTLGTLPPGSSTPFLTAPVPIPLKQRISRNSFSCNSLASMDVASPPPSIATSPISHASKLPYEHSAFLIAKAPLTQVYQCFQENSPDLTDRENIKNLATCIAMPHEAVEEQSNTPSHIFHQRVTPIDYTMARYQIWWNRVKRQRLSSLKSNGNENKTI